MTFQEFAKSKRPEIEKKLLLFLKNVGGLDLSFWGSDLRNRFSDFVTKGKLLRGSLLMLSYEMFGGIPEKDAIILAAAIELFHSSFLIHDDIMDQDRERRGNPTFFAQYESLAATRHLRDVKRTGESLATCAGDIGFFLGFSLLNTISDEEVKQKLLQTVTYELTLVGLGQMQDVALGASGKIPTEEEILQVYRYKTARYTFSLPLILGAILAGKDEKTLEKLTKLGEYIGTIYQIKDDELNLFGDKKETGKPVGSDIREGKKTLYWFYLSRLTEKTTVKQLSKIFGQINATDEDIRFVKKLIENQGIQQAIDKTVTLLSHQFREQTITLTSNNESKGILMKLLTYSLSRKN